MKKTLALCLIALAGKLQAANITLSDPSPQVFDPVSFATTDGGVPYRWTAQLAGTDSGTAVRHVGAWSWEDNALFDASIGEPPVGWTHTSDWVALTLNTASTFTLRLEVQGGVAAPTGADPSNIAGTNSMFPSFTIYQNWDGDGSDDHTYNNRGNIVWAEDLVYLDHLDNSTASVAERSWILPAGNYSLALGSNAPATDPNRQGYLATFTTAPVPEPSTGLVALIGLLGLIRRNRK